MALLQDISVGAIPGEDPKKQIESVVKQLNEWGRTLSNEDRTTIIKDDAQDPRLLMGYQKDGFTNGNVGAKMSQLGTDVTTATSSQLIWSTDFNSFKIIYSGYSILEHPAGILGTGANGVNPNEYTDNNNSIPSILAFVCDPQSSRDGTLTFSGSSPLPLNFYIPLNWSQLSMSAAGVITEHVEIYSHVSSIQSGFFFRAEDLTSGNPWVDNTYNLYIKYFLLESTIIDGA